MRTADQVRAELARIIAPPVIEDVYGDHDVPDDYDQGYEDALRWVLDDT